MFQKNVELFLKECVFSGLRAALHSSSCPVSFKEVECLWSVVTQSSYYILL
jgi:hypothetical protein